MSNHLTYAFDLHRPVVERANEMAPAWAHIQKEMILVADPAKPLPRVAKGTIMRAKALEMYEDAIEKLYASIPSRW